MQIIRRIHSAIQYRRSVVAMSLVATSLAAILIAACGGDSESPTAPADSTSTGSTQAETMTETAMETGPDLSNLGGEIRIDGSSTVFPVAEAVAEEFSKVSNTRVNVAFSGTGGGFEKFCRGETQISDASRPIKDSEVEACADNDIDDIIEFQVAIDALTVMVNPDNDFADCMTTQELNQLFRTDGASSWSDINSAWPAERIEHFNPGADSGTFDYFNEVIIEDVDEESTHRGDGTASEDDNILAAGIAGGRYAVGYFGFAYFLEAGQNLKAVKVDDGEGCVEPTFDNALSGTYAPLSRPLFIYTRASFLQERPEVAAFLQFFLENTPTLVPDVGYVTMPDDLLQEQLGKLATAQQ